MRARKCSPWRRVEQQPMVLIAFCAAIQAAFLYPDPLAPHGSFWLVTYAVAIVAGVAGVVGRLADNRRRVWPLHIESAGCGGLAGVFLYFATQSAGLAPNGYELVSALCGYGAIAAMFLIRWRKLRRAIRILRKGT